MALNPTYRIFLNFAKSFVLLCLSKFDNIKKIHVHKNSGCTVAMVNDTKMKTCSPMAGQFFDTMIVALSEKEWI